MPRYLRAVSPCQSLDLSTHLVRPSNQFPAATSRPRPNSLGPNPKPSPNKATMMSGVLLTVCLPMGEGRRRSGLVSLDRREGLGRSERSKSEKDLLYGVRSSVRSPVCAMFVVVLDVSVYQRIVRRRTMTCSLFFLELAVCLSWGL